MENIHLKLLRHLIKLLERVELKLNEPQQRAAHTINKEKAAGQEPQPVPFLVSDRPVISIVPELVSEWRSNQHENEAYNTRVLRVQKRLFWATLGAFVAAAVYAWIAQQQKRVMELQSLIMNEAFVESRHQGFSAERSANAALSAANTAGGTLREMKTSGLDTKIQIDRLIAQQQRTADASEKALTGTKNAAMIEQRAWIGVVTNPTRSIDFGVGKIFVPNLLITNTGRTPAMKTTVQYRFTPVLNGRLPNFNDLPIVKTGGITPPNSIGVFSPIDSDSTPLDQTAINSLGSGFTLFVYGLVAYDDAFGFHHWTSFCYTYAQAKNELQFCGVHNEIDNELR